MEKWRQILAEDEAHRQLISEQRKLAKALGIKPKKRQATYQPPRTFEPRYEAGRSTIDTFNRLYNLRHRPYPWMDTGPWREGFNS